MYHFSCQEFVCKCSRCCDGNPARQLTAVSDYVEKHRMQYKLNKRRGSVEQIQLFR